MVLSNPYLLLGIVLLVLVGGAILAWHFWGGSLQKRLRGTEKMGILIWKRAPKVEVDKLEVESTRYLADHSIRKAWFFDSGALLYNSGNTLIGLLISNDSCIPQYPGNSPKLQKICEALENKGPYLWRSRCMSDIEKRQHEQSSNAAGEWLGIAALAIVLGCLILGGIALIPSLKGIF